MSPAISIIVPVHRQWQDLPHLLAALAGQTAAPSAFEVVIIDNDPDPHGQPAGAPLPLRYLHCAQPGSYAARNAGVAIARGELLVFTDADCRPRPDWLATLLHAAATRPGQLLAGRVDIPLPPDPNRWQIFDAVCGMPQHRFVAHGFAATANLAVPAPLFRALGGFDATRLSGGDAEFCRRAGRLGHPLALIDAAVVDHPARASLAELATKARRIKGGQIAHGPFIRRLIWVLRSLTPPLRESLHYLGSPHSLRHRLTAIAVRFRLWQIELTELIRLLAGVPPERR